MEKKRNIVEWAMHYRQIVILITAILVAFGIYGLVKMNKNEFPNFTVRQGIVIAAYPGATSDEIEEQVTKPLEDYIFSYKEVKKDKTVSYSRNNMAIVQVELNDDLKDKDEFWSKFKHGIQQFKSELPSGVYAILVNDDFGDTSSLLLTMESDDKTYWELNDYMKSLKDSIRQIESVGRLTVSGMVADNASKTGLIFAKYAAPISQYSAALNNDNLCPIFFRYAEVLLTIAECDVELNDNLTEALNLVDQLRVRGGMTPVDRNKYDTQSKIRTLVRRERTIELAGEGFRRQDIIRWKDDSNKLVANSVMNGPLYRMIGTIDYNQTNPDKRFVQTLPTAANAADRLIENRAFQDYQRYLPIPQADMDKNPKLTQTPGYE